MTFRRPKFVNVSAWAIALCALIPSQFSYAGPGTTSADFLQIAVGARPAAMGEAYLGLADDATAMQWNPAGMAQLALPELTLTHLSYFADINYEYVGFGFPFHGQGLGLGLTWLNVAPFNSTLDPNAIAGSASDYSLSAAYALPLSKQLSVGVVARTFLSDLASNSALGASMDVGALFQPFGRGLSLAVVAQNLGLQTAFDSASDPLPIAVKFGTAWRLYNDEGHNWFNALLDVNKALDNNFHYNVGAELWLFDVLALRAGYKLAEGGDDLQSTSDSPANFTVGAGFRFDAAEIDYAFVPLGELGYTHRITASWKFGFTPDTVEKDKVLEASPKFGKLQGSDAQGVAFNLDSKKALGDVPMKEWRVEIRDKDGKLVRTLSGQGPAPRNLAWDLKLADGRLADRDQPYKFNVMMRDYNGHSVAAEGFIAKEIRPKELMDTAPKYDAAMGGLVFKPRGVMNVGVKEWKLNIRDAQGNVLKTLEGTGAIPKNLVWTPPTGSGGGSDLLAGRQIQSIKYDLEFKDSRGQSKVVSDQVHFAVGKAEEDSYRLPLPLKEFKVNRGHEILVASLPNLTSTQAGSAKAAPFVMPVPGTVGDVRSWRFDISAGGKVVRTFKGKSDLPDNLFWDGLDESGAPVKDPEKAKFNFSVVDEGGEEHSSAEKKTVRNPFTIASAQGQIKKISGIWFRFLDSDIQEAVRGKLHEVANLLKNNPNVQVTIQGHAWDEGSPDEVLRLSQERADTVLRFLIEEEGLSPRNVSAIGYGDTMPLVAGRTEEAAAKNRRVEVIIVAK
jgi:outer membrane protein OmpA-like peptidoglycan-associated protein